MVDGVAYEVDQRIAELVNHPFVEFGLFPPDLQVDSLAALVRQVSNDAFEAVEQRPHRSHPSFQDASLEAVRYA